MQHLTTLFLLITLLSCSDKKNSIALLQPYEGPILEVDGMETIFSDSAKMKVRLKATKELDFENGDKEFPEGVFIEFYEDGKMTTTLEANIGYYNKKEDLYTGVGDVIVKNSEEKQQLNTEELHWKPKDETIFTEKFVRIESGNEILLGEGLVAHQDFKTYTIIKPTGEIYNVDEN